MQKVEARTFRTMRVDSQIEELVTPTGDARIDAMRHPLKANFSCWLCQLKLTIVAPHAHFEDVTFCVRCHPTVALPPFWLIQGEHERHLTLIATVA